jgi:glycosyltransferase involved in cell wall biosynthesis
VSIAGAELVAMPEIDFGLLQLRGRGTLVRASLRRAALVGVGSRFLHDFVGAELPDLALSARLRLLPLGVDLERFSPGAPRPACAKGAALLSVGSLTPVKDQARLIGLLPRLHGRLTIAGDGVLADDLRLRAARRGVAPRIGWAGAVDHGSMPEVYRAADLLVQTSRFESQGLAVLEAAACGVPVVGTPVGVLPEIGRSCRTDRELVEAIDEAVRRGRDTTDTVDAARALIEKRYALDVSARAFLDAYAALG